ncbi:MAG: response regulator [Chloroflexota bacterium]|nr:response regulator [Chloroflexota bacterium]
MATVAIIDDNPAFGERLVAFVTAQSGCTVVGLATDAVAGLELVKTARPDIVLSDIGLPAENGFWFAEQVSELGLGMSVILMSDGEPEEYSNAASLAGAIAYIPKRAISTDLPALLRLLGCPEASIVASNGASGAATGRVELIGRSGGASGPGTAAVAMAATYEHPQVIIGALASAMFLGFASGGHPTLGLAGALGVLLTFYRQSALPRHRRGQAGGRPAAGRRPR